MTDNVYEYMNATVDYGKNLHLPKFPAILTLWRCRGGEGEIGSAGLLHHQKGSRREQTHQGTTISPEDLLHENTNHTKAQVTIVRPALLIGNTATIIALRQRDTPTDTAVPPLQGEHSRAFVHKVQIRLQVFLFPLQLFLIGLNICTPFDKFRALFHILLDALLPLSVCVCT